MEEETLLERARESLAWLISQMQGDSGTGDSYWGQFPQYQDALAVLNMLRTKAGPALAQFPHAREATAKELAPVLQMPEVGIMLAGGSANGKLASIHANTHGNHSFLIMQLREEVWGYRISLPTREERKTESRRIIAYVADKLGAEVCELQ